MPVAPDQGASTNVGYTSRSCRLRSHLRPARLRQPASRRAGRSATQPAKLGALAGGKGAKGGRGAKRQCVVQGCTALPRFNLPGVYPPICCTIHRMEGQVCMNRRPCSHVGCWRRPHFAPPGTKTPMFCGQHKRPGNVNVLQACGHQGAARPPRLPAAVSGCCRRS